MPVNESQEIRLIESRYRCGENVYAKHDVILRQISDFICAKVADHLYETMGYSQAFDILEFSEEGIQVWRSTHSNPGCYVNFEKYNMGKVLCPKIFMHALFPHLQRDFSAKVNQRFKNCGYNYSVCVEKMDSYDDFRIYLRISKQTETQSKKLGSWL